MLTDPDKFNSHQLNISIILEKSIQMFAHFLIDHLQFTDFVLHSLVLLAFKSLAVQHLCHKVGELAFFRT